MRWAGICLVFATLKLAFASSDFIDELFSESDSYLEFSADISEEHGMDMYLKSSRKSYEDTYIQQICSNDDPVPLYELYEKVGEGRYGRVYRGKRRSDGRQVAIKVIAMDRLDILVRELRALDIVTRARGRPRSLPVMYSAYRNMTDSRARISSNEPHAKRLWIVMEWIDGVSILSSYRKEGRFEMPQVRRIMKQVMDTLCYLHQEQKLIHGDLIPQNIMLSSRHDPNVRFVDFGMSRMIGESPHKTIAWELSKAGEIAYRLLFGQMPSYRAHDGHEERMTLAQLCKDTNLAGKVPRELLIFINACIGHNAHACQLKEHAFLKESRKMEERPPIYPDDDSADQYDIDAYWDYAGLKNDLYR